MSNVSLVCRTCGDVYELPEAQSSRACPSCGTVNARPRATGDELQVLRRAAEQRISCDFAAAEESYQQALRQHRDEHEAYWGLLLCRYAVEYVRDSVTGRIRPVVHGVRSKPMQTDGAFARACEHAPDDVRAQYEEEARYIDQAMLRIRSLHENTPPYDVFICHKTKEKDDGYTEDFRRAEALWRELTGLGYRVFFAPEELAGLSGGANYEAGIYHAMNTARVMFVICSDRAKLYSPWVRSEWSRFLEMLDASEDRRLVPLLYGGMPERELPRDFTLRGLQTIHMGEISSMERVLEVVRRAVGEPSADEAAEPEAAAEPIPAEAPAHSRGAWRWILPVLLALALAGGAAAWRLMESPVRRPERPGTTVVPQVMAPETQERVTASAAPEPQESEAPVNSPQNREATQVTEAPQTTSGAAEASPAPTPSSEPVPTPVPTASPAPSPTPYNGYPVGKVGWVWVTSGHVRSGPGQDYEDVGDVLQGEKYRIDAVSLGNTGKDWYQITLDGQRCWISSGLLEVDGNRNGTMNGKPLGP